VKGESFDKQEYDQAATAFRFRSCKERHRYCTA